MSQNCTDFSSIQDIETIFAWIVGFSGSTNSNVLSEFSREQRELPWQPNFGQNKPILHWFHLCTKKSRHFAVLAYFVCQGNSLWSLENSDNIFGFVDPQNLLFTRKTSRYLVWSWNRCNFGLFWPKFRCHGNSLCSPENTDSTFEFATQKTLLTKATGNSLFEDAKFPPPRQRKNWELLCAEFKAGIPGNF